MVVERVLAVFLLFCIPALAEHPSCYINRLSLEGTSANVFGFQMRDQDDPNATYTGRIYVDDPTFSSPTDFVSLTSNGDTANYTISNATFGTGTKNLQDGASHILYMLMVTKTQGNLTTCTGQAWPYQYNTAAAGNDFTYPLATTNQVAGATPLTLSVIANVNDPYSIGSSGATITTVNGTAIKSDGVAGYYIQKYGIPLSHVHVLPLATTARVTLAAAQAAYRAMTPPLSSAEQFNALAWVLPYQVTNMTSVGQAGTITNDLMSMAAFFYNNGVAMKNQTITTSGVVAEGDSVTPSPYFRSASIQPFTELGVRPTFQLAWGTCDGGGTGVTCSGGTSTGNWRASFAAAKAGIDAAFAARGASPAGGVIYTQNNTFDFIGSAAYSLTPPRAYGTNTGVVPDALNVTVTALNTTSSIVNSGRILSYEVASVGPSPLSAPAFIAPGVGYMTARNSLSGDLTGASQPPVMLYLLYGAAFSCGSGAEPYGMIGTKYPEEMLMMSLYTRGATAIESAWKATKQPYNMVCVGDPLAHGFPRVIGNSSTSDPFKIGNRGR